MEKIFRKFRQKINADSLTERVKKLGSIEKGQTFRHYRMAAEHMLAELKKYNIPNAEILTYPADGITSYEDKCMPMAWDATIGILTLCDAKETVIADFSANPFNLIKGSVSTAPGGEIVRVVTEQQMLAGEDVHGAMVLLDTSTRPYEQSLSTVLDLGARGIISDYLLGRFEDADAVQWVNACTEGHHWHVIAEDRDFIGFSISLRMGIKLRELAAHGNLKVRMECDGRRYCGELPAVTALIPGRRSEEVWLLAHTFEPLLNDDSTGVTACIEIARLMLEEATPEYSLRLVFAMEVYGYAAFHANFKGKAIGACNLDDLPSTADSYARMVPPIRSVPFHGVNILKEMAKGIAGAPEMRLENPRAFDDMFLSDSTTAIPTVWIFSDSDKAPFLWHNSLQNSDDFIVSEMLADSTALAALWTYRTINFTGEMPQEEPLQIIKRNSEVRKYASEYVFKRKLPYMPFDLISIPKSERRSLPDGIFYGPFAHVLSRLDGIKNLAEVLAEAEAEYPKEFAEKSIRKYINALNYLADYGYIEAVKRPELTAGMLTSALEELGVAEGDTLLVHASLSNCGYFADGAKSVIDGIQNAVTAEGTALFAAFTYPFIYLNGVNKAWFYRPYDSQDFSQIYTGQTAKTLLQEYPQAVRSRHITHSWAGIGRNAAEYLESHGPTDPPVSKNSPVGKALQAHGKILYIGSELASTTFLHYLENELDLPYLQQALCKVRIDAEHDKVVSIDRHLPGHRDFYRPDAENSKFFSKAKAVGLEIKEYSFGIGKLHLIELDELYRIGMQIVKDDPNIFLCDDQECFFCRQNKQ